MNIGNMMIVALNNPQESEKNLGAVEKIARAVLSQNIYNASQSEKKGGSVIEIKQEQIDEIKVLMNSNNGPLLLMKAYEILDDLSE